jgi:hypothetical protein
MTAKVYSTVSGRRATTDIEACADAGHVTKAPRYNTLLDAIQRPDLTPLLTKLVMFSLRASGGPSGVRRLRQGRRLWHLSRKLKRPLP